MVIVRSPLDEVGHRGNVVFLVFNGWQADVAEVAENAAHLSRLVIVVYRWWRLASWLSPCGGLGVGGAVDIDCTVSMTVSDRLVLFRAIDLLVPYENGGNVQMRRATFLLLIN